MKKILRILFITVLFLDLACFRINADMGPKPSVNVTFENAPEGTYYVTLLSKTDHYGPWSVASEDNGRITDDKTLEAYRAFMEYEDPDGYYFLNFLMECKDDSFSWSYYPPEDFKIAYYDPADGSIHAGEKLSREAFDSYFIFDCGDLSVREEIHLESQLIGFGVRLVVTILVEVLIGLLFGYREKIRTIVIVNLITQIVMNLIMAFLSYYMGALVWLFIYPMIELAVLAFEMIVYLVKFRDHGRFRTVMYAVVANVVTFFLGLYSGFIF